MTTVKVPQEKCHLEPSVVCDTVLKRVPELTCVPEVMEECNIFPKETPFLVDEEECEEVVYDECVEVSEKIPVEVRREISLIKIVFSIKILLLSANRFCQVCTRTLVDETSITLERGPTIRWKNKNDGDPDDTEFFLMILTKIISGRRGRREG